MSKATELAGMLDKHAEDHFQVAQDCDMRPTDTLNWKHFETSKKAATELRHQDRVIAELVKTGLELKRFYAHIWDRADGSIFLMESSVEGFEIAFEAFCAALTSSQGSKE